jgi:DNA-binding MarR family transcriptional regulator
VAARIVHPIHYLNVHITIARLHEYSSINYDAGMAMPRRRRPDPALKPHWLSADELDAWRAIARLLGRLPTALERQLQRDAQLSYLEYHVLAGLADQPNRSMRMCQLAAMVDAELSRMSHLIRRLEQRGFVRREVDATDRRSTLAILTEAGHAHLVAAAPSHVNRVRELVIDALTPEELLTFKDLSNRVIGRIEGAD